MRNVWLRAYRGCNIWMNPLMKLRLRDLFLNLLRHPFLDLFQKPFPEPLLFLGLFLAIESARAEGWVPAKTTCEPYFRDTRGLFTGAG